MSTTAPTIGALVHRTVVRAATVARLRRLGILLVPMVLLVTAHATRADESERQVEEIVVTANRRAENVQDVPSGISVLDGSDLEKAGAAGFEDYIFNVPGADVTDSGLDRRVAIRGISNTAPNAGLGGGSATSPIGLYLNDVPIQGNGILPDLSLYDLSRIEVLKGPQGTLYGEGAQGGAIRMLLTEADPSALSAKGEVGVGHTRNGSGLNQFQNAAVNVPLLGSWAVRLVGSRRIDQGFIDFPNRGTRGEDDAENLMGRVHLDGDIWDGFSLSGLLLHQRQRLDQFPTAQLAQGDLKNQNREPQFADTDFTLAGLTLDYDLGFATVTSATSWFRSDRQVLSRFPFVGAIVFLITSPVIGGDFEEGPRLYEEEWIETDNVQDAVAQELRIVSADEGLLRWIGGFFFRKRENEFDYFASNSGSNDPPPVGPGIFQVIGEETFEQVALFGETTVELPWRLELGAGLRLFREEVELSGLSYARGALYPVALAAGAPSGTLGRRSFDITTTAFTPKVSLSWYADDARMVYAQVAKGVRSGGTNPNALASTATPLFEPDNLWSYEVGAKTQWLDGFLTANVAAFYNDWQDLQVSTSENAMIGFVPVSQAVILNVARAFTRGVELELLSLPIEDLTLGFNLFVGEGRIVEGDPAGSIPDDTPVPQLAKLSYSAFTQYTPVAWSLFGFTPSLQFDTQFTGDRTAFPPVAGIDPSLDGFQLYNTQATFSDDRWELAFGVRNLTDVRQQLGANAFEPSTLTLGRPRTWTTRVTFRF